MHINFALENKAIEFGWDYYGVADLTPYYDYLRPFCGDFIYQYPRAISLAFKLADGVLDTILDQAQDKQLSFNFYCYQGVDLWQDTSTIQLARTIEKEGFKAYPIPASYSVQEEKLLALFPHKLAAQAAGLGWLGKNGLLTTPKDGPRVRLATILTDAKLKTGQKIDNNCGNCQICIGACPAKAIEEPSQETLLPNVDMIRCFQYQENRKKSWGINIKRCICGVCQAICPYGRKNKGTKLLANG